MDKETFEKIEESIRKTFIKYNWNTVTYFYIYEKIIEHLNEEFNVKKEKSPAKNARIICPKCNRKGGRLRLSTKDYRCEKCQAIFQNC